VHRSANEVNRLLNKSPRPDPHEADQPHRGIRGTFKTPTTPDVTKGIKLAIEGAIAKSAISLENISSVMIGTTVRDLLRCRPSKNYAQILTCSIAFH
jgi:hypothetical protein